MKIKTKQQGFSLIEVVATLTIIAVLAIFAMPKIGSIQKKASLVKAQEIASTAYRSYRIDKAIHHMSNTSKAYSLPEITGVLELDDELKANESAPAKITTASTKAECVSLQEQLRRSTGNITFINIPAHQPFSSVIMLSNAKDNADEIINQVNGLNHVKTHSFKLSSSQKTVVMSTPCPLFIGS